MHPLTVQRVHCIKIGVFSHIKTQRLIQKSLRFLFCQKRRNIVVSRTQINDRGGVYRFFVQKNKSNETIAEYNETIAPMVAFFRGGCMFAVSLEFTVSLLRITKNRGILKQKSGCPISIFCNIQILISVPSLKQKTVSPFVQIVTWSMDFSHKVSENSVIRQSCVLSIST